MAAPPTANGIKTQLLSLLNTPLGSMKKAKLLDYLPLAVLVQDAEDITVLQSPSDTATLSDGSTTKRINCLMVTELGFSQSPPQSDGTQTITAPRGRNLITRRFGLVYLYQFGSGSEAAFSTNVEVIRTTLNSNPKLSFPAVESGVAGRGAYIDNHGALQMQTMLPASFAGVIAHVAEGTLEVRVLEPLGGVNA